MVGERWGLLIVRDLLVGPKRFTDLHRGLPGIPTNILTARLKELEGAGVVRRRILEPPARSIVYELTEYGLELKDVIIGFGRWGAKSLGELQQGEIVTPDSLVMALRSTFRPQAARGVHAGYELRVGDITIHARIDDGTIDVAEGPLPGADLVIETGPAIKAVMSREMTAEQAIKNGSVRLKGNSKLFTRFADAFQIDPMPVG